MLKSSQAARESDGDRGLRTLAQVELTLNTFDRNILRVCVCVCVCVQKEEGGGGGRDGEVTNKNYCKSACTFLVFSPLRDWKERDAERMKKKIIKQTKPL